MLAHNKNGLSKKPKNFLVWLKRNKKRGNNTNAEHYKYNNPLAKHLTYKSFSFLSL